MTRLCLVMLALSFAVAGRADASSAVVKVMSYHCDASQLVEAKPRKGSGTLIAHDGELFVLTSAHVIYHGRSASGICHRILTGDKMVAAAELTAVNFANGLALLKVSDPTFAAVWADHAQPFAELRRTEQSIRALPKAERGLDTALDLKGFHFADLTAFERSSGALLATATETLVLPGVERMLSVESYTVYGMSGGAALSRAVEGRLIGVISHHFFRIPKTGGPATIERYGDDSASGPIITLVIPLATAVGWLEAVWRKEPSAHLEEDVLRQLRGETSVKLGQLRLTETSCRVPQASPAGRAGDPNGVGGDGIGIGGSGDEGRRCLVKVERLAPGEVGQPWPFAGLAHWHDRLAKRLDPESPSFVAEELYLSGLRLPEGVVSFPDLYVALARLVQKSSRGGPGEPILMTKDQLPAANADRLGDAGAGCLHDIPRVATSEAGGCRDWTTDAIWSSRSLTAKKGTEAVAVCEALNEAGHGGGGWRLPTIDEVIDVARRGFARDHFRFRDVNNHYWTIEQTLVSGGARAGKVKAVCSRAFANLLSGDYGSEPIVTATYPNRKDVTMADVHKELLPHDRKWVVCVKEANLATPVEQITRHFVQPLCEP